MRHVIKVAPLLVVAATLMGLVHPSGCNRRGLATQPNGFSRIESIAHPVAIKTRNARGAGWIKAFNFSTKQMDVIYLNPAGDVNFNDVIPEENWKCDFKIFTFEADKCVASLLVGDEQGGFTSGKRNNRVYVCTNAYKQTSDRIHCGSRMIEESHPEPPEPGVPNTPPYFRSDWAPMRLGEYYSHAVEGSNFRNWQGDQAQLLFSGKHTFSHNNNSWDPGLVTDNSGHWHEYPWTDPPRPTFAADLYSVDIGVCSEFIPWKWEDRDPDGGLNDLLGGATGNLGIAEAIVDGMADNPIRRTIYTEDAKLWMDSLVNVWNRPDSAEFHFRVNEQGRRQMCFVQYIAANNKLKTAPDSWYRFDQAFLAAFLELFRIGDCPTNNARIQYCGELKYNASTKEASFVVDPSTAKADMEGYSWFRPACKTFRNKFTSGFASQIAGPAGEALTENLGLLVSGLPLAIGADLRRIETTPRGVYLVVANESPDPQYGKGQCIRGLEADLPPQLRVGENWSAAPMPATGITRP